MPTTKLNLRRFGFNTGPENIDLLNEDIELYDALANIVFASVSLTAQPTNPAASSVYFVPVGASGAEWAGNTGKVAVFRQTLGWHFFDAFEGLNGWVIDEGRHRIFSGSAWIENPFIKRTSVLLENPTADPGVFYPLFRAVGDCDIVRARYDLSKNSTNGSSILAGLVLYKTVSHTSGATIIENSWTLDSNGGYESTSVLSVQITNLVQFAITSITGPVSVISVMVEYIEDV